MSTLLTIGTLTTTGPVDVVQHYECAAWEKVTTVPAGTYTVVAYVDWRDGLPSCGHSIYAQMSGTITGGTMCSRIGSHVSTRDDMKARYGQADDVHKTLGTYYPVRAGVTPREVDVVLRSNGTERTIKREIVDVADLVLPAGLTLDPTAVEVAYTFESAGTMYATIKPVYEAYAAAFKAARAA